MRSHLFFKGKNKRNTYQAYGINIHQHNLTMLQLNPHFITDENGNKISVVLPIKDFKAIMEELEELEDIKLYDEAKESDEPSVVMDEAFKMIEAKRKVN